MSKPSLDIKRINEILKNTINTISNNRNEIQDIAENVRKEVEKIKNDLNQLNEKIQLIIREVDLLEVEEKRSRARLVSVSKNFKVYKEEDIKEAYENAKNLQIKLILKREEEKNLTEKRREMQIRLKNSIEVVQKADKLIKQVSVAIEYLGGNIDNIIETIDDISKRQYLGIRIIEAQEEERQRLARDIHDGPAQSMANIVLKSELCEKLLNRDIDKTRIELKNLKEIVRFTLKDIRKIIYDLRPMSLDDLGLIPTVQRYISNFIDNTNIAVQLKVIGESKDIAAVIKIATFRIIQEALNNIQKHSRADRVTVTIENLAEKINVLIIDDGVGFDNTINACENHMIESGFGIVGMRERAELLGGSIQIKSRLGNGTKVFLTIPIDRKDDIVEK